MTPYKAKKIAEKHNCEFFYDRNIRFWTMHSSDLDGDTVYISAVNLRNLSEEQFLYYVNACITHSQT